MKIGQMLIVGLRGLELHADNPIVQDIQHRNVGGVILFDYDSALKTPVRNIQSPAQLQHLVNALQAIAPVPLFIALDQEGGKVNRLKERFGFPPTVSAHYLGQRNQLESTRQYAEDTAKTLAETGVNLNFAPVVDLNCNPDNPVIGKFERSFSGDPDIVCLHAVEWIKAHHAQHVLCALKHFPGHGSARSDSHLGFVDVTETWSPLELQPYSRIIAAGLCDIVMTAHIFNARLDPTWPATLSQATLTNILRRELSYDGLIVSDDMQMKAITAHYGLEQAIYMAISAGVNILIFGNNLVYEEDITARVIAMIKRLVERGTIAQARIDESYQRICRLKKQLSPNFRG